ncbi:A1pp-domain-containing protein [Aureobasidium subglaciale]|nr:A1pp-domain-containing protein [Aureobasidium subglaciale]
MSPVKTIKDIPTLSSLYKLKRLLPASSTVSGASSAYNDKICVIRTDITKLEVDAIVNAANESLLGGGGVDGAIHRAAGDGLYYECEKLDGCKTGDAKITNGYELPCKKVIHTVGPVYWSTKKKGMHTSLLQSCYRRSLDLAAENGCKSIAFSALSTGVYGYPSGEAAHTAIGEVKKWLDTDDKADKLDHIIFCNFMEKDEDAYYEWLPKYFPSAETSEAQSKRDETKTETKTETEEQQTSESKAKGTDTVKPRAGQQTEMEDKTEALGQTKAEESGQEMPELPSVPTAAPGEHDQPDAKKIKVDHA